MSVIARTLGISLAVLALAACETTAPVGPTDPMAGETANTGSTTSAEPGDADTGPTDLRPGQASASGPSLTLTPIIPMLSKPLPPETRLTRIAFGSCLKQEDDQSIWQTVEASDPDLFLFIGDNVYGDIYSGDPAMPELRSAYNTLAKSTPFASLRANVPVMAVWDDHDYGLNDAGGTFALKYGTEALFEEAWALPADDPRRARDGVYTSDIVGPSGERVQIILLDTRFFRDDLLPTDQRNAPGKERYLPDPDRSKTMLGEAQYAWLVKELQKPADLRIIVSSIQVIAEGHGWEAWNTLPAERQRLYDTIGASGAEHVILLSGDRHAGGLYKTHRALPYPLYEITSSSLNAPASVWRAQSGETRMEAGPNRLGPMMYEANFGLIDIDWSRRMVTLSLADATGAPAQAIKVSFAELQISD
ncbi:putative phosphodiesterase/alkaline phosphatase D [Parvularcula bermudensis HTCC2503]|uniref:Putative phosphodiesterase/alkaline phosphatase D n=1 Tax=Parvularcula bermudensis (strain ATCC BAA-594 / HTCC2503 / KCTC 12087) TaxID=314260 RepID=E0TFA6_PARBH|nr:alkaline phosphatase D family protein [Parvularcula bermudensis]ADM09024.1 putative phosphodiesterase/alkaline phosphatase D [Parvularcula bermudensis HTCC2503]